MTGESVEVVVRVVKTKKDVLTEFRTTEILEAARRIFAKRVFHDATVDDIAAAAGLAKGTVYLYYRSKQEIYLAALKLGVARMSALMLEQVNTASTTQEKLRALIAAKLAYCDENKDFFKIYYSEVARISMHPGAIDTECKALYLEQARIVETILKGGIKEGHIRLVRLHEAAFAITDLIRGVATQRVLGWSKSKPAEDADFIFDFIWKGIAA
jgi:AcrR family transcriptional regulator